MNRKQRRERLKRLNHREIKAKLDDSACDDSYWHRQLEEAAREELEAMKGHSWGATGIVVVWGFYLVFINSRADWWDALSWSLVPVAATILIGWFAFWKRNRGGS